MTFHNEWLMALLGGALIGLAASILLGLNGRILGVSGILQDTLFSSSSNRLWRGYFLGGLLIGGVALTFYDAGVFSQVPNGNAVAIVFAGLLVGFGTSMGNGCTSGHGVCGISRLSVRSMVATIIFIGFGVLSVFLAQKFFGAP